MEVAFPAPEPCGYKFSFEQMIDFLIAIPSNHRHSVTNAMKQYTGIQLQTWWQKYSLENHLSYLKLPVV